MDIMKIQAYIINLKTSRARKEYMQGLLSGYPCLNLRFIEATDGRVLSEEQRKNTFNMASCLLRYGRIINPGEIGCTLSHYQCYRDLVASQNDYVLILEDDISIVGDINFIFNKKMDSFLASTEPKILFLSGDYWYWKRKKITRVFSAVGSYAYFINKAAASRILNMIDIPFNVADDWDLYKSFGIGLYAVYPYVIDANVINLPSDIKQEHWGNLKSKMDWKNIFESYCRGVVKRILVQCGHFESKIRHE